MLDILQSLLTFASINSFLNYGLIQTIEKLIPNLKEKEILHKIVMYFLIYSFGIAFGFFLKDISIYQKLIYGCAIGAFSVALYDSAIKYFLSIIPSLFKKFIEK